MEQKSLVLDHTSEWRKRPINLLKVISSFVSQLTVGDDLTKISLPTEICHPFSMLEIMSHRELLCFSVLFDINKHPDDSFQRFLVVCRWLLSCLQSEQMEKKPFNAVIGEQHTAWIEHEGKENWTEFISEQVSHHPPVSAFFVRNKDENITLNSNLQFSVHFGGNHATILSSGTLSINTAFETYKMNKVAPDMNILNVVWGTKYFMWEGSIELECPETGYKFELTTKEQDPETNILNGLIKKGDEVLYEVSGICGVKTEYWKPGQEETKEELFNFENFVHPDIKYLQSDCQVAFDSLKLWKSVADPIIIDDMWEADLAKKKIEKEQREREKIRKAEGREYEGFYFENKPLEDGTPLWVFNNKESLNPQYLEKLREMVKEEEKKQRELLEEAERIRLENGGDPVDPNNQESCVIS